MKNDFFEGSYQYYIADDLLNAKLAVNKRIPLAVVGITKNNFEDIKNFLINAYGDVLCRVVRGDERLYANLGDLTFQGFDALSIDGSALTENKRFDFSDAVEIMKRLRADDGCEWDKAQTHESIRINLIEEAYELVEAIDCASKDMMLEETGDVLMQSLFHTEIAEEEGQFDFNDMLTALCRKLIDRHTHIFGKNHADNADEALNFWIEAKKKEKKYSSDTDAMDRVPKNLPSLLYAGKLQKIARKSGFDFQSAKDAENSVLSELEEFKTADAEHISEEAGDLLFSVVNLLRFYKIDAESALHDANVKFFKRYSALENEAVKRGKSVKECSLDELNEIWDEIKSRSL